MNSIASGSILNCPSNFLQEISFLTTAIIAIISRVYQTGLYYTGGRYVYTVVANDEPNGAGCCEAYCLSASQDVSLLSPQ
jgi:hypothetical protein